MTNAPSYCGKCGAEQVAQHSANNAQADANAAAAEFLRSHGQYLFVSACGGEPRCEIDLELALVMRKLGERVDDGTERYELDTGWVTLDDDGKTQLLPPRCSKCRGRGTMLGGWKFKCDRCNGSGTDPDDRKGTGP